MKDHTAFDRIARSKYVSLITYRRDGAAVSTPVWIAPGLKGNGALYVLTMTNAGKLKRIGHTATVRLAPCTFKGMVTGPDVTATARILPVEEHRLADRALTRKYPLAKRLLYLYHRLTGGRRTYIELRLEAESIRVA